MSELYVAKRRQVESGWPLISGTINIFLLQEQVRLGALDGQEESVIHKSTDDLSDLKCILRNHEHGVKKNRFLFCVRIVNEDSIVMF